MTLSFLTLLCRNLTSPVHMYSYMYPGQRAHHHLVVAVSHLHGNILNKQIKQALLPRKTGKAKYIPLKLAILGSIVCKKLCNAMVQGNLERCTVDHTMPHGAEAGGSCGQWALSPSLTSLSHSPFKVNCAELEMGHRHGWEGTGSKWAQAKGKASADGCSSTGLSMPV